MNISRLRPLVVWLSVAATSVAIQACDESDDASNDDDDDDDDDDDAEHDGDDEDGDDEEGDDEEGDGDDEEGDGDEDDGEGDGIGSDGGTDDGEDDSADGPSGETCEQGEFTCDGASIDFCDGGEIQTASCSDVCGQMGYTSSGCDSQDGCLCDGLIDQECATGASAMCTCFEWAGAEPCSDEDFLYLYDSCWDGSDSAPRCVEDYVVDNSVDCEAAYACFE